MTEEPSGAPVDSRPAGSANPPGASGPDDPEAGPDGDAKPLPGEGTPDGDRLREAHAAFVAGDYRSVRSLCDGLLEVPDDGVAAAAHDLRRRTEIDPVQIAVILGCLVLFGIIVYVYVL